MLFFDIKLNEMLLFVYLKINPFINDSSLLKDTQNTSVCDEISVTSIATPITSDIDKISIS
jgi:hypothetical protein